MAKTAIMRSSASRLVAQVLDVQVLIWLDHRLLKPVALSGRYLGGHEAIVIAFAGCYLLACCRSCSSSLLHRAVIVVLHPKVLLLQVLWRVPMYWLAQHLVKICSRFRLYVFQLLFILSRCLIAVLWSIVHAFWFNEALLLAIAQDLWDVGPVLFCFTTSLSGQLDASLLIWSSLEQRSSRWVVFLSWVGIVQRITRADDLWLNSQLLIVVIIGELWNWSLSFAIADIVYCGDALLAFFFNRASCPGGHVLLRARRSCCLSSCLYPTWWFFSGAFIPREESCLLWIDGLDLEAFIDRLLHMYKSVIVVYLISEIFIIHFRRLRNLGWSFCCTWDMILIKLYLEIHVGKVRAFNQDLISLIKRLHRCRR